MNNDNEPSSEHLPPGPPPESPPPYEAPIGINGLGRNPWSDEITIAQYIKHLKKHVTEIYPRASPEVQEDFSNYQPNPDRQQTRPHLPVPPSSSMTRHRQGSSLRNETTAIDPSLDGRPVPNITSLPPQQASQQFGYGGPGYTGINANAYQQHHSSASAQVHHGHGMPSGSMQHQHSFQNQMPYGQANMSRGNMQKSTYTGQGQALQGQGSTPGVSMQHPNATFMGQMSLGSNDMAHGNPRYQYQHAGMMGQTPPWNGQMAGSDTQYHNNTMTGQISSLIDNKARGSMQYQAMMGQFTQANNNMSRGSSNQQGMDPMLQGQQQICPSGNIGNYSNTSFGQQNLRNSHLPPDVQSVPTYHQASRNPNPYRFHTANPMNEWAAVLEKESCHIGSARLNVPASAIGSLMRHIDQRGSVNTHGQVRSTMNMSNMHSDNTNEQLQQPQQMGPPNAVPMMTAEQRGKMIVQQQREQNRKQEKERQLKEQKENEQKAQTDYVNHLENLHLRNLANLQRMSSLGGNPMSAASGANSISNLQEDIPPASESTSPQQTSKPSRLQVPGHNRPTSASLTKTPLRVQEASTPYGSNKTSSAEGSANHLLVPAKETPQTSLLQDTNDLANIKPSSSHYNNFTSQNFVSGSTIGNLDISSSTIPQEQQQNSFDTNLPPTTTNSQFGPGPSKGQEENMANFLPENIDPALLSEPFQLSLPDEKKRKASSDIQSTPSKKAAPILHFTQAPSMNLNASTRTSPHSKLIPNSAMHMNPYIPGQGGLQPTLRPEDANGISARRALSAQGYMNPNSMHLNSMSSNSMIDQPQSQQFGGPALGFSFGSDNQRGGSAMGSSFGAGNQGAEPAMDFSFGAGTQTGEPAMDISFGSSSQGSQPYTFKANDQPNNFISPSAARLQFREAFPQVYRRIPEDDGTPMTGNPLGDIPGLSEYNFDNISKFDTTKPGRQPMVPRGKVALDQNANAGMSFGNQLSSGSTAPHHTAGSLGMGMALGNNAGTGNVNQSFSDGSTRGENTTGGMDFGGSSQVNYGADVDMDGMDSNNNQFFGDQNQDCQAPEGNYDWAGPQYPGMVRTLAQPDGTVFTFSDGDLDHIREMHEGGYRDVEADWSDEAAAQWAAEQPDLDIERLLADLEPIDFAPATAK